MCQGAFANSCEFTFLAGVSPAFFHDCLVFIISAAEGGISPLGAMGKYPLIDNLPIILLC